MEESENSFGNMLTLSTEGEDDSERIRSLRLGNPYFSLIYAFLKLNMLDLGIIRHGNGRRYSTRAQWASAKLWVEENSGEPMGFKWVFNALKVDAAAARENILKKKCKKCKKTILEEFCRCSWHESKKRTHRKRRKHK